MFDRVLCDVPCSGMGVIRRKPELKEKDPGEFASLPEIQYRILCRAADRLAVGGKLVYSTCTIRPEENEAVLDRFLKEHPSFEPDPLPAFCRAEGYRTTLFPDEWDCDGFFLSRIRRVR